MGQPLSADLLRRMHAYWRAANYLLVGSNSGSNSTYTNLSSSSTQAM